MLKGKAKLTLRDAKNGLILFQEEHHNAITPALERIFNSNLAGTLNYNALCPLYSKMLGGVCLFDNDVDNTDVFLPSQTTAKLTAHAGQDYSATYAQYDTKVGQPSAQSGILMAGGVPAGYRWVWTWDNNQGNGQIKSIVLTHSDTGSYWNETLGANVMAEHFKPVTSACNGIIGNSEYVGAVDTDHGAFPYITNFKSIPLGFYEDINHIVSLEVLYNKFVVHISKFTGDGCHLWNTIGDISDVTTYNWTPENWQWGTWGLLGRCCYYVAYDAQNKRLYAVNAGSGGEGNQYVNEGTALQIDYIDLTTGNASHTTQEYNSVLAAYDENYSSLDGAIVHSTSGPTFWITGVISERSEGKPVQVAIVDNSIYLPIMWHAYGVAGSPRGRTDCSLRINLSDNTDAEVVKGYARYASGNSDDFTGQINLGNGRVMNLDSMSWKNGDGECEGQGVALANDIFNTTWGNNKGYVATQPTNNPVQYCTHLVAGDSHYNGLRGCILNKLYQATVFPVEGGPVLKTAAMTMTVEYSIYQTQEEPSDDTSNESET